MKKNCMCIAQCWWIVFFVLVIVNGLQAKDPEITTTVAPHFLFEGSKVVLEIKHTASHRFKWEFGDGQVRHGSRRQTHIYKSRGFYKIVAHDMEDKFPDPIVLKITILKEGREIVIDGDGFLPGTTIKMRARKFITSRVKWDFGDGTFKTSGWNVTHAYKKGGTYTVKVTDYGGEGPKEIKRTVTVLEDRREIIVPKEIMQHEKAQFILEHAAAGDYAWKFSDGQRVSGLRIKPVIFKRSGRMTVEVTDRKGKLPLLKKEFRVERDARELKSSLKFALTVEDVKFEAVKFKGPVKWDLGNGKVKSNGPTKIKQTYKKPGRYTIKAIDYNGKSEKSFSVTVTVGELTPTFQVNLLELAFNSGKYYHVTSIKKPSPGYYLKIKSTGRGLLKGQWILDKERVGLFEILLRDGNIAELRGNDVFRLPRHLLGSHNLTVSFSNYRFNRRVPILRYFVTETDAIQVTAPQSGSRVSGTEPVELRWLFKKKLGQPAYQLLISEIPVQFLTDDKITWHDIGAKESYIPDLSRFRRGAWVYWQVRALNSRGKPITTSEISSFKLSK